jgi:poly-beta-1,6-N-acetyl-D-glucosamine biosynthesis protein PgaD
MKAETILIDTPEKQSLPRRILYGVLTVVAWLLWGLLWLPALHVLAGKLDIPFRDERWMPDIVLASARDIASIVWLAPASLLLFAAWSFYEGRHRRRERRQRRRLPASVPLPEAAESLGASTDDAQRIQDNRRAVLRVDEEGHIDLSSAGNPAGNVTQTNEKRRRKA